MGLVLGLILTFSTFASAQDVSSLFETHYRRHYRSGKCGLNVRAFVQAIEAEFKDVSAFSIVRIENTGFSMTGLVNAEAARGQAFGKPVVDEVNWYFHVVVLDNRGMVYDFDYGITPTVLPMEDYIEKMFLDEAECRNKRLPGFCIGRDVKLDEYVFESHDAQSALAKTKDKPVKATMREVLKSWKVLR